MERRGAVVVVLFIFGCGGTTSFRDGGSRADGGAPLLDGGRRLATWREGVAPIVNDVAGWQVPPEATRVLYPVTQTHSPLPASVADRLRNVALHGQGLQDNVFMKLGDSITDTNYFMGCYVGDVNGRAPSWEFNIYLDGRNSLAEAIFHFRSSTLGRVTPFDRVSRVAKVGSTAAFPLSGRTPPLEVEFDATHAQFALTMFGTNDLNEGGTPDFPLERKLTPYARNLLAVIDWLLVRGIVPLMSTIPPRNDAAEYLGLSEVMNAVVRAIAQGRQVPLVDFHREMMPLLDFGLGGDGVHPSIQSYNSGCHFRPDDLEYGYHTRNLVMLEGLHRSMRVVVDGQSSLDEPAAVLQGSGTRAAPYVIPSLPFSDLRDVKNAPANELDGYSCPGARPGTGAEHIYQLTLTQPTRLRVAVIDATPIPLADAGVVVLPLDVDLHLLDGSGTAGGCVKSADSVITTSLGAGTWFFSVDRDLAASRAASGEFVFVVVPCAADDRLCAELAGP